MEPIAALSIASNIIQIVDFASRFVSRSQELYQSADGKLADHIVLDSAAQNLSALCNNLHHYDPDSEEVPRELTAADAQMLMLRKESEAVVNKLRSALETASKGSKNKAWRSIYQALKSIYNDNEISNLASQLDNIRKQVDTTLLFSLRYVCLPTLITLTDNPKTAIRLFG
jgi:DNA repair exonuclease SbcCD ATPase subunit